MSPYVESVSVLTSLQPAGPVPPATASAAGLALFGDVPERVDEQRLMNRKRTRHWNRGPALLVLCRAALPCRVARCAISARDSPGRPQDGSLLRLGNAVLLVGLLEDFGDLRRVTAFDFVPVEHIDGLAVAKECGGRRRGR